MSPSLWGAARPPGPGTATPPGTPSRRSRSADSGRLPWASHTRSAQAEAQGGSATPARGGRGGTPGAGQPGVVQFGAGPFGAAQRGYFRAGDEQAAFDRSGAAAGRHGRRQSGREQPATIEQEVPPEDLVGGAGKHGRPPRRAPSGTAALDWAHSGPIPIGRTGPIATLTGGIALGLVRPKKKRQTVSGFDPVVRGRGLARLSRRPQPTTASELQRACVRWVVTLWAMVILLQRFSVPVPGVEVSLLIPICLLWCVYGQFRGVLEFDRHRFGWWLAAAGVSAVMVPLQYALVPAPLVSLNAWGLLLATWLVFIFRLRDRRRETYLLALRGLLRVGLWQATLIIFFLALQLVVPYTDWIAQTVPPDFLLKNYTLAYPFSYGSPYNKSNGWIGLETSFTSIQLAFAVMCAILLRRKLPVLLYLLAAIACTGAMSGFQMIAVAIIMIIISPMRWALARYSVMVPTVIAFLASPLGLSALGRLTEGTGSNTSTGQRFNIPYQLMWPKWIAEPMGVLLGRGPGSSQSIIERYGPTGTIDPTPVKLFFEYGVVAGLALAIFLTFMYLGGPSRSMAAAMASAYFTVQPAATQMLLVITIPLFITWWTPRPFKALESDHVPSPNAAIAPAQGTPFPTSRVEVHT